LLMAYRNEVEEWMEFAWSLPRPFECHGFYVSHWQITLAQRATITKQRSLGRTLLSDPDHFCKRKLRRSAQKRQNNPISTPKGLST